MRCSGNNISLDEWMNGLMNGTMGQPKNIIALLTLWSGKHITITGHKRDYSIQQYTIYKCHMLLTATLQYTQFAHPK